jgi:GT2 family glycosyltransferase
MPTVSAVVPATDAPPTLARCLAAIRAAEEAPEELLVVDAPAETGPAAARNAGVERARGEVVVFVDADVLPHRDAFARIRRAFERDPGLTAVFGAYDDRPEAPGLVSRFRNLLHHHVHVRAAGPAETFWAGLGAVRRDAFVAAGGFDADRYPAPAIEDVELGLRLADAGATIRIDPDLQGTHLKRWTLRSMVETDVLRRGAPWTELLLERRSVPATLNLGHRDRVSASVALLGAVALLRGRTGAAVLAGAGLVALNPDLYALLARRLGIAGAAACVPLHALHHVAAAASVPVGAVRYLRR